MVLGGSVADLGVDPQHSPITACQSHMDYEPLEAVLSSPAHAKIYTTQGP